MLKDLFSIFKDIFTNKKLLMQFSYNDFRSRYASSTLGIFLGVCQSNRDGINLLVCF